MTVLTTSLPQEKMPYLLRRGEGRRYVFEGQLATVIADAGSTGGVMELTTIAGAKGEEFPAHSHPNTYESIYVLEGKIEWMLDGAYHLLTAGDYVHIPPGTVHAYRMAGHRNCFASYTVAGSLTKIYEMIGEPYAHYEHPPRAYNSYSADHRDAAAKAADIVFVQEKAAWGPSKPVDGHMNPGRIAPYLLENGEGDRLLTGDQLHRILATQQNTDGEYIIVATDGPKGDPIVEHYHNHHTETFFCVQGQMTMWANGEEVQLYPGDFLHVPAGTLHSYRFDAHYTKVVGLLASGLFEPFFRALGEPYEDHAFPAVPGPLRMDRVMAIIDQLDLNVVAKSPLDRK
ncbi:MULTISPECIES: quercetin 2,3-dioxygenase [Paenibacillus]|uniref:quercetin 2,3-dioxygenase n=1 Tax=Paenibacillus TaxID=44249 RepID=UPI0022B86401|nr:quercetin 2,3-dioxygenase [Paenibacillus caseinilyticus]MCZ8517900.1 quercetin 2,3-dioxygenase [Paenibacillus caseinilyticus]